MFDEVDKGENPFEDSCERVTYVIACCLFLVGGASEAVITEWIQLCRARAVSEVGVGP